MTPSVLCVGTLALDTRLSVLTNETAPESVNFVRRAVSGIGGKGWTTAATMARLGHAVGLLSLVGAHSRAAAIAAEASAREFTQLFAGYFVHCLDEDHMIWLVTDPEHNRITYSLFREATAKQVDQALAEVDRLPLAAPIVYLSAEHPAILEAVRVRARGHRKRIVLNLSMPLLRIAMRLDPPAITRLIAAADILLLNTRESRAALEMLDIPDWSALPGDGPTEIIVTAGVDGGRFAMRPFRSWTDFPSVPVAGLVFDIGAGDTFNGAYLVARLLSGMSIGDACAYAAAAAAEYLATENRLV